MKKAMLFMIALLFSVSANAATLHIFNDYTDSGASLVGYNKNDSNLVIASYQADGNFEIGNVVTTDTDTMVKVEWTFNPDANLSSALIAEDGRNSYPTDDYTTTIYGAYTFTMLMLAGQNYYFDIKGLADPSAGVQLSLQAVPVPAAAFLFAPALLGLVGLRRKSQAVAA